jgi:hypothetical protein
MDLRYWKCPKGHISIQNFGYSTCWCSKCKQNYDWSEGEEVSAPPDEISDKEYPYD